MGCINILLISNVVFYFIFYFIVDSTVIRKKIVIYFNHPLEFPTIDY